ncbi:hypothetical protein NPIL_546041 [Nephila pilipes]|uniref:Uncharacterized protein n=1 Tax=Nephila pilipes TaxID=299642 RepID=A0A8X6N6U3_NEPPI|nr:hypothetical protein NPIL_546041 [Nephila pilipes]
MTNSNIFSGPFKQKKNETWQHSSIRQEPNRTVVWKPLVSPTSGGLNVKSGYSQTVWEECGDFVCHASASHGICSGQQLEWYSGFELGMKDLVEEEHLIF